MAGPNYPQNQLPTLLQGYTAQTLAAMDSSGTGTLGNSSGVVAPGTPNPADARPGYLAAGQPGGNPADVLVPGGQYNTDNQIQDVSAPAGTAGGGGYYPGPVNPMVAPGWTAQGNTGDVEEEFDIVGPEFVTGAHATTIANLATYVPEGGTSTYTWSINSGALPTGVTQAGGVLSAANTTAAGTSTFQLKCVDSSSPTKTALKNITLTLT